MSMQRFQWVDDDDLPPEAIRLAANRPSNGQTYAMYHGTTPEAAQSIQASGFRQSSDGMLGRGVYLSRDLDKASRYPIDHPEEDRVVLKVVVNVGKVKKIDTQDHWLQKTWHDKGYDTAWVPPNCGMVKSGLEENCIWNPKRITILKLIYPELVEAQYPHQAATSSPGYGWS